MPLSRKLQRVADELAVLEDPQERLGFLVDRARAVPPLPASERVESNRVRGCVSVVWIVRELRDGRCSFRADAESPVVRALVSFLCDLFSRFTPQEIAAETANPLDTLGLTRNLSPTRRNGLNAAHAAIREFAVKHAAAPPA